jgi:maleylpyruvate isomerase
MKLYGYFRSSAAYRVRIALNIKGMECEREFVHLRQGDNRGPEYLALNPQGVVPTLVDGGLAIGQSLAIMEYLDEINMEVPLLPSDALGRARVRQLAQIVACDIHPLDNLKVLTYLREEMGQGQEALDTWYRHWIETGLAAFEALLADNPATGLFCHGDDPGLADACLVPQLFNARRFDTDLSRLPTVLRVEANCNELQAFRDAAPDNQPDAE